MTALDWAYAAPSWLEASGYPPADHESWSDAFEAGLVRRVPDGGFEYWTDTKAWYAKFDDLPC